MSPSSEPSDVTHDAWADALVAARKELGEKEFRQLSGTHSYESCSNTLAMEKQRIAKKWSRFEAVMGPILNVLRAFDQAVSTCVSSHPQVAALIWGSVQALLMVTTNSP
ncbi:hypothetical protein GGR52DRAFT_570558 [Hypoxylon sp. FL1284]|nr:hypothetical protein GGR52DRAFT_570558 [Hypoxylon sp. FL1284]